jgi:outer membrane protein assembly factor BamB
VKVAPVLALVALLAAACGASKQQAAPRAQILKLGGDWARAGYTTSRRDSGPSRTGITAANVTGLRRQQIRLDGTVDSWPIYLRGARIAGGTDDVFIVTTTYGKTIALDADTGRRLWEFTPSSYARLARSPQITTAGPLADRRAGAVYTASPDGRIHRLALATGKQVWSAAITRDARHEKIASPLNLAGGRLIAATGGYIGDAPSYQGHVVTIAPRTGRILHVWNSLCSNRHTLIVPRTCGASDSAIWGRNAVVVEPGTGRLLFATGNAPWNGRTNWGDSVLELSADGSRLLQNWTPSNQAELNRTDADLGSTSPALLPGRLALQGGKDARLHLLDLRKLNGTAHAGARTGGDLQNLPAPGGDSTLTAPAVWASGGRTWVFVGTGNGTGAYTLSGRRLHPAWHSSRPGLSPIVAGGLLYVYDPSGRLNVLRPTSGSLVASLPAGAGHWQAPIVTDGRIALPEGDANDHEDSGILDVYRAS